MREPMQWSFPVGRLFGAVIRIHVTLPVVMLGLYLKAVFKDFADVEGIALAAAAVAAMLFFSILAHEFGHVFAARAVGGDSDEILMWPLGGLAMCSLPHQPRAHFLTALAGPLVTLSICVLSAAYLVGQGYWPPLNPFTSNMYFPKLNPWTTPEAVQPAWHLVIAARLFALNWFLFLFNLLPAYPMDGGQMLHAVLWSRSDDREATGTTAYVSFGIMLIMCVLSLWFDSVLLLALVIFIYDTVRRKIAEVELGTGEGGYDVGYGAADREANAGPKKPRLTFYQRWRQRRAAEQAAKEQHQREDEERRMDELLEKVQQFGLQSLSNEERRFMNRVSNRYRNNRS